jgi:ATP-dependent DNA helicase
MYHGTPSERAHLRKNIIPLSSAPSSTGLKVVKDSDFKTQVSTFPVVITTFEMVIKDRVHLAKYEWGFVVVDEGHRLKNMDSRLMREIKKYSSAARIVLTGTPLQVRCFLCFVNV